MTAQHDQVKDTLRANVKENLDFLSDDDPSNDWQGYRGLAMNLMFAGQDENALAAWSLIGPDDDITLSYKCDGGCDKIWTFPNDIWVCKDCPDVQFDEACLKLLQEDKLEDKVCNKNHELLYVPKYDVKTSKAIGKGKVMVGDSIMTVDAWLDGLRKDWGLTAEECSGAKEDKNAESGVDEVSHDIHE
jgi:hypothetical protein